MSEQNQPPEATEQVKPTTDEIVEIEWEQIKQVFAIRYALIELDSNLSSMMIAYEKKKAAMLKRSADLESAMMQEGQRLRAEKNLDEELTYELKLPAEQGEKAYFIRKDQ